MHTRKDVARIVKTVVVFSLASSKGSAETESAYVYLRATFIPFCVSVDNLFGIQASHFIQQLVVEMEILMQCHFLMH